MKRRELNLDFTHDRRLSLLSYVRGVL